MSEVLQVKFTFLPISCWTHHSKKLLLKTTWNSIWKKGIRFVFQFIILNWHAKNCCLLSKRANSTVTFEWKTKQTKKQQKTRQLFLILLLQMMNLSSFSVRDMIYHTSQPRKMELSSSYSFSCYYLKAFCFNLRRLTWITEREGSWWRRNRTYRYNTFKKKSEIIFLLCRGVVGKGVGVRWGRCSSLWENYLCDFSWCQTFTICSSL